MADNVTLNTMSGGAVVATDEVTDGTLGTVQVQYVKLMDGALNGTTKSSIDASFGLKVDVARTVSVALAAGSNVIGAVTQSGTWTTRREVGATIASSAVSVGSTATTLVTSSATRRSVGIYNNGSVTVFVGPSGVTTSNGFPVLPGGALFVDEGATAELRGIVSTGTCDVRVVTESN